DPDEAGAPKGVAANEVTLQRTITDKDLDPVVESFDLGANTFIKDDGPSPFNPTDIVTADAVQNQPGESATKDLSGNGAISNLTGVNQYTGNDGFGSVVFTGFTDGAVLQG